MSLQCFLVITSVSVSDYFDLTTGVIFFQLQINFLKHDRTNCMRTYYITLTRTISLGGSRNTEISSERVRRLNEHRLHLKAESKKSKLFIIVSSSQRMPSFVHRQLLMQHFLGRLDDDASLDEVLPGIYDPGHYVL